MPGQRHGWGWGHGRGLRRGQIARLAEPCMLTLLQKGPRHGYELIGALEHFGLAPEALDSAQIYRILRQMEEAGWVLSEWEPTERGPARRVYRLTPLGEKALARWKQELEYTHEVLHKLLGMNEE